VAELLPSFLGKLDRAEKHLRELEWVLADYAGTDKASRPYTVRKRVEGKKQVYRLHFTRSVANTTAAYIAADAIYNLRSSLDHLMSAMVSGKRTSVTFLVFWKGVWQPFVAGENAQRRKDRERWLSTASVLPDKAVAFLKKLQPPDETLKDQAPHGLRILNQLSNTDRHTKLPLVGHGVDNLFVRWKRADGTMVDSFGKATEGNFVEDQAKIHGVPPGAVYVEAIGTPVVVIRTGMTDDHGKVNLPVIDFISNTLEFLREKVMPGFIPYVRNPGGKKG
jgi:hypothetical protein